MANYTKKQIEELLKSKDISPTIKIKVGVNSDNETDWIRAWFPKLLEPSRFNDQNPYEYSTGLLIHNDNKEVFKILDDKADELKKALKLGNARWKDTFYIPMISKDDDKIAKTYKDYQLCNVKVKGYKENQDGTSKKDKYDEAGTPPSLFAPDGRKLDRERDSEEIKRLFYHGAAVVVHMKLLPVKAGAEWCMTKRLLGIQALNKGEALMVGGEVSSEDDFDVVDANYPQPTSNDSEIDDFQE